MKYMKLKIYHTLLFAALTLQTLQSHADSIAPVRTNAAYFKSMIPPAQYVTLTPTAGHYIFLNTCTPFGKEVLPPMLCRDTPPADREEIHKQVYSQIHTFLSKSR